MPARFIGALPDPIWRAVLAHYLARADEFRVHMPDGEGPLSVGRAEVESLPDAAVGPWDGMRDAVEISGPLSAGAVALFSTFETSLIEIDPDRKLWDYALLDGTTVLLTVGDFTDLLIDEPDPGVLRLLGVQLDDETTWPDQSGFDRFPAQVRRDRAEPGWQPGAMRPEERERLVRIGLSIVLGDRAGAVFVRRNSIDTIEVGDAGHAFGFPADAVLGDDPRTIVEHDLEWLIDELCECAVAWAERLPGCPQHPGAHPLDVAVTDSSITASCPVTGATVRSAAY